MTIGKVTVDVFVAFPGENLPADVLEQTIVALNYALQNVPVVVDFKGIAVETKQDPFKVAQVSSFAPRVP